MSNGWTSRPWRTWCRRLLLRIVVAGACSLGGSYLLLGNDAFRPLDSALRAAAGTLAKYVESRRLSRRADDVDRMQGVVADLRTSWKCLDALCRSLQEKRTERENELHAESRLERNRNEIVEMNATLAELQAQRDGVSQRLAAAEDALASSVHALHLAQVKATSHIAVDDAEAHTRRLNELLHVSGQR